MVGEWGPTTSRTVDLGYEQLLMLEGRPGTRVKVIYGGIWLTEEGHSQDRFATSGDEVAVLSRRRAVIEGLGATRIELVEPVAPRPLQSFVHAVGTAATAAFGKAKSLLDAPAQATRAPRAALALLAGVVGVAIPVLVLVGITTTAPVLSRYL